MVVLFTKFQVIILNGLFTVANSTWKVVCGRILIFPIFTDCPACATLSNNKSLVRFFSQKLSVAIYQINNHTYMLIVVFWDLFIKNLGDHPPP